MMLSMGGIKKIFQLAAISLWLLPFVVSAQAPIDSTDVTALSQTLQTIELHIKQNTTARLAGQDIFADPTLEQAFINAFGTVAVQQFSLFCPVPNTILADNTVRLDCIYMLYGTDSGATLSYDSLPTYFILASSGGDWQIVETDLLMTIDSLPTFDADFFFTDFWSIFLKMFFWISLLNLPIVAFVIWMIIDAWKRDPENRVMWLVLMIFLGYLAALIYYFSTRRKKIAELQGHAQARKSVYWGIGLVVAVLAVFIITPQIIVRMIMKDFFPNFSTITDKNRAVDQSQPNLLDAAPVKQATTPVDLSDNITTTTLSTYSSLGFTYEQLQQALNDAGYAYLFEELFPDPEYRTATYMGTLTSTYYSMLVEVSTDTNEVAAVAMDFPIPQSNEQQADQIKAIQVLFTLAQVDYFDEAWLKEQYQQGQAGGNEYTIEQSTAKQNIAFSYNKTNDLVAVEVTGLE